jgi:hypothetical protein
MRLIWAWHSTDPVTVPSLQFNWHGGTTRGVRSVLMRTPSSQMRFPDARYSGLDGNGRGWDRSLMQWDVTFDRVRKTVFFFKKYVPFVICRSLAITTELRIYSFVTVALEIWLFYNACFQSHKQCDLLLMKLVLYYYTFLWVWTYFIDNCFNPIGTYFWKGVESHVQNCQVPRK